MQTRKSVSNMKKKEGKENERYDAMLVLLEQPHSLRQIAVKIHLNPRYTKQRLGQLEQLGLIEQTNGWYQKA